MVHVAREMQRRGLTLPLLIGGATTSAKHTAVKIAPQYEQPTVHVLDASRCVGVVDKLISPRIAAAARARKTASCRSSWSRRTRQRRCQACAAMPKPVRSEFQTDWADRAIFHTPAFIGVAACSAIIRWQKIVPYIDWSPFFMTWELKGKYPRSSTIPTVGATAQQAVRRRASSCSAGSSTSDCSPPTRVYGFWPATATATTSSLFTGSTSRDSRS